MAKTNNAFLMKMAFILVGIIFAAGAFYVLTDYRLGEVEVDVKAVEKSFEDCFDEHDAAQEVLEDAVSLMQYDVRHIKERLIKQETLNEVRHKELLKEIRK